MMDLGQPRPRVNAALLQSHQGRNVCLLGNAHDIDQRGTSFILTTSDQADVNIRLQEPLQEYVQGLIEVHGEVGPNNEVLCNSYVLFPPEISQNFNLEQYDKAVEFLHQHSKYYMLEPTES